MWKNLYSLTRILGVVAVLGLSFSLWLHIHSYGWQDTPAECLDGSKPGGNLVSEMECPIRTPLSDEIPG